MTENRFADILRLIASGVDADMEKARWEIFVSKIRKRLPKDQLKLLNQTYEICSGKDGILI